MSGETNQVLWRGVRPVAGIQGIWPAIGAVRVHASNMQTDAGTTIVYTVPAGKKLFIPNAEFSSRLAAGGANYSRGFVRDAADVQKYYICYQHFFMEGQLDTSFHFVPALEAAAGYDVCVFVNGAGLLSRLTIHGWLEDA